MDDIHPSLLIIRNTIIRIFEGPQCIAGFKSSTVGITAGFYAGRESG